MHNHPPLSPRLRAIANLIQPCHTMADIGTDHAYLPVWLCLNGVCDTAIGADINRGPLDRAEETVRRFGLTQRVDLRLGSGAEPLSPGEADAFVIAGMGGLLIGELLKATPEVFQAAKQILLQPMSSIPELREELYRMGYSILEETLIPEEEKLYHIISVKQEPEQEVFTQIDFVLGRKLCRSNLDHFEEYLEKQRLRFARKLAGLRSGKTVDETAVAETEALLKEIEKLMTL